eukprot:GHRR01002608.1.p1 GENE.GHRR01002608.1~~GHRR01002608.1.p1  ORF type:complete len:363 (+),score=129.99 GHRR01002608.1:157-1245(+)
MESLLIVGTAAVGKYTLIRGLQIDQEPKTNTGLYTLTLDTKYYTAEVLLRSTTTQHQLDSPFEALVLVFDASQKNTFDRVRAWAETHITKDTEIQLLVANKADLLQQSGRQPKQTWHDDAMKWACEHGFEYIKTAAGCPSVDAQLQSDGDQQGVARVLAALQAHVWPDMVPKQRPVGLTIWQQSSITELGGGSSSSSSRYQVSKQLQKQQQRLEGQHHAPDSNVLGPDKFNDSHSGSALHVAQASTIPATSQQHNISPQAAQPAPGAAARAQAASQSNAPVSSSQQDCTADPFMESDLDGFEQLMRQMAGMRPRLSSLPDAERRSAAAEMALKLATMMGLESDTEDSDEDSAGTEVAAVRGL